MVAAGRGRGAGHRPGQQRRRQLPGQERGAVAARGRRRGRHRAQGLAQPALWRSAAAGWREGRRGTVLSIVTSYAWTGSAYVLPSAVAKAGVLAMTRSLAVEWGGRGVRLNADRARAVPDRGRLGAAGAAGPSWPAPSRPATRWAGPGEHRELADLAAYLLADGSAYINGEVVAIDGGEWLKGAGQFSFLMEMLGEADWQALRPGRALGEQREIRDATLVLASLAVLVLAAGGRWAWCAGVMPAAEEPVAAGRGADRRPVQAHRPERPRGHRRGVPRPADAGLFRLHLLPRHVPLGPARRSPRRSTSCRPSCRTRWCRCSSPSIRRATRSQVMHDYVGQFSPRLIGLTGSEAAIAAGGPRLPGLCPQVGGRGRRRQLPCRPLDLHLPDGARRQVCRPFRPRHHAGGDGRADRAGHRGRLSAAAHGPCQRPQAGLNAPDLRRPRHAPVAQWIEHLTTDQKVGGSSPSGRAMKSST